MSASSLLPVRGLGTQAYAEPEPLWEEDDEDADDVEEAAANERSGAQWDVPAVQVTGSGTSSASTLVVGCSGAGAALVQLAYGQRPDVAQLRTPKWRVRESSGRSRLQAKAHPHATGAHVPGPRVVACLHAYRSPRRSATSCA